MNAISPFAVRPAVRIRRPVFATIRKRAQRLKLRVEDLLRVARSESGEIEFDRRPLGLASVLAEAVDNMASEAARRRVGLSLDPGTRDVECLADREWIRQTVESLVDNALRHADGVSPGRGRLDAGPRSRGRITVTDDGPGFGASETELFERFRRGEGAGPDETGFGIGLALARWIVEQHGGSIRLGPDPTDAALGSAWTCPALDPAWRAARLGTRPVDQQVKESAA